VLTYEHVDIMAMCCKSTITFFAILPTRKPVFQLLVCLYVTPRVETASTHSTGR